jgi:hypothetical protein
VLPVLQAYAAAWSAKDVDAILRLQPGLNRRTLKTAFGPVRVWLETITPLAQPVVSNDRASVKCQREIDQTFSDGTKKQPTVSTVVIVLKRQGPSWVIEDVR